MGQYLSTGYLQRVERQGKLGRGPVAEGTLRECAEMVSCYIPQSAAWDKVPRSPVQLLGH